MKALGRELLGLGDRPELSLDKISKCLLITCCAKSLAAWPQ